MFSERVKAIVNLIVAFLLLLNAILTASGKNPLPVDQDAITITISYIAAGLDTVWIWWKNQNITVGMATGTKIGHEMNAQKDVPQGIGEPEEISNDR